MSEKACTLQAGEIQLVISIAFTVLDDSFKLSELGFPHIEIGVEILTLY